MGGVAMAIDNAARSAQAETSPPPYPPDGLDAPRQASSGQRPAGDEPATGAWEVLGKAVLAFHYRVALTAMCQCGRTVVECDVQHHARQLGLLPPLPRVEPA